MTTMAVVIGSIVAGRASADEVAERLASLERQVATLSADKGEGGLAAGMSSKTSIGGYGELHYNDLDGKGGASDKAEVDFHRFVLFFGHRFSDRIRLQTELEVEHTLSGEGKPGEVEIEQAFIDFDLNDDHTARVGLFIIPVGILNQHHEPPLFYGVERNPIEANILPTTWWEAGAGLHGSLVEGLSYQAYVHSGLATTTGAVYAVRSGRKKVAKAPASDPAATLALVWNVPGLTVGGAVHYQADITQGEVAEAGSAWMGEVHAEVKRGPFGLRGLYAEWQLDGDGPESVDADRQFGWFIEPSLRLSRYVGVFARFNQWDNQAGSSASKSRREQIDAGLNWWPHEQVVLKADYQWQDNRNGTEQEGMNLAVGYAF